MKQNQELNEQCNRLKEELRNEKAKKKEYAQRLNVFDKMVNLLLHTYQLLQSY